MPQDMNILCCYSCKIYQVHIVKKARKWRCKLCNAKQSIRQIYFQGSGKDCRLHVQRLNYLKANDTSPSLHPEQENNSNSYNTTSTAQESDTDEPIESKRAKYLDSTKKECPSDTEDLSVQKSNIDKHIESKRAKYLDSTKKECPSDTEDLSSDNIHKYEGMVTNEKSPCNAVNNDSRNFEATMDSIDECNSSTGSKVAYETEVLRFTSFNYNRKIEDKCNSQDNVKSNRDYDIVNNLFETYSELDDPIDI
ncbi:PREDICTED: UPF0544 protein C5orf45 homolog [Wasmannia auropunctata]|uniref:UPF0544 protein C5orf45 homolog n=1 Tax=Wasmannia auropunctata TaxID=64793 RepID=UPI0005ED72BE|nr:PREDICTED: UPF0544 protein C5orf45 homolog [Wasmannia auropunctata]